MVGAGHGTPPKSKCKPGKGAFYPIDKLDISHVEVVEEVGQYYCVKWFDNGRGMLRRRGGNEGLYKKGARPAGLS